MISDRQKRFFSLMHRFGRIKVGYRMTHLSQGEFMMLQTLRRGAPISGDPPGTQVSEVTRFLGGTKSATSKMLRGLEEKGYIERRTSRRDRRQIYVSLTGEGEEILIRAQKAMDSLAERVIQRMGGKDIDRLLELMEKLQTIMEEEVKSQDFLEPKEREEKDGQDS